MKNPYNLMINEACFLWHEINSLKKRYFSTKPTSDYEYKG
jgi:hypothetical protein